MVFVQYIHNKLCFAVILFLAWICNCMVVSNILPGCFWLCMVTDLFEAALDCGISLRHFVDVFWREYRPCIEVSLSDWFFPCVLYWAECCRMYILDGILLVIDLCMLLIWYVGLSRIWIVPLDNPVITSCVSCNTIFQYLVTAMVCWLKLSSHPESHNLPTYMRELCDSPSKVWVENIHTNYF